MEIQELKDICQKFLKEHLGKNLEINDDSDETGLQVYSTLYEWNLNENQKGEISFWCSNGGWKSEDGAIKEDDVVCWLCLERYTSVTQPNMEEYLNKEYHAFYDKKFDGGSLIKQNKLFVQTFFTNGRAKNTIFISYCFKNNKANYDDEFHDFFEQLISGNLISNMEINELKKSIIGKFIKTYENNVEKNSYLQNIYDGLIFSNQWNSNWFNSYKNVVEKFIDCGKKESWDDETLSLLVKNVSNGISSLKQKNFENADYAKIKTDWVNVQPIVKQICVSTGVDEDACGKLSEFLYQRSREKLHSAVHRVIAAFLPNKVSTIIKKSDFDYVSKKLSEKLKDYPSITNDWLKDNINFIEYCNKNVIFKHPWHSSLFAWHLKKIFKKEDGIQEERTMKINEIVKLLENNYNIILHGAPGTGKTYLAKEIARTMGAECEMIQFHQSYDYTDFVEGLRPAKGENGMVDGFELRDGEFKSFCKKAIDATRTGAIDNYEESFQKIVSKLETENVIEIPLISGKGNFYIALNSDGDGFVTMLKDEESGKFTRDSTRFFNYEQCYNVYRGLPGTPKKGFDNYRKAIVKYMKDTLGLKEYQEGKNTETSHSNKFVFIIDEINRGEMSKIFGELFFSIESGYRGEKGRISTQYQNLVPEGDAFKKGFYVPENVYIIGTMNDIDRSVESMDFAMRRRFAFEEITAEQSMSMFDNPESWKDGKNEIVKIPDDVLTRLKNRMRNLNAAILDSKLNLGQAYQIGGAYFLKFAKYFKDGEEKAFANLWNYHLKGLLTEYLRGMPKAADHLNKLKECYDKSIASESSDSSEKASDSVENS